jgi:hypothetical protein
MKTIKRVLSNSMGPSETGMEKRGIIRQVVNDKLVYVELDDDKNYVAFTPGKAVLKSGKSYRHYAGERLRDVGISIGRPVRVLTKEQPSGSIVETAYIDSPP